MPRSVRKQCESNIYHVVNRGTGKQIIFESDLDRAYFIKRISTLVHDVDGRVLAWCLMDNHFHLILRLEMKLLSLAVGNAQSNYSSYFNRVHGRTGSLFGSRFKSEPITSNSYLMTAVRYVHANPIKANICNKMSDYRWSSYNEYMGQCSFTDTDFVLDIFEGIDSFETFHDQSCKESYIDVTNTERCFVPDNEVTTIAATILNGNSAANIKSMNRVDRDAAIFKLKRAGMSVRQIQRLTGISLGTISRAGKQ